MKKILLITIALLSFICKAQSERKIEIIYGAEKEILPEIDDTIKEFTPNNILKKVKFRDKNDLTIIEFFDNGSKYKSTKFPLKNPTYKTLTKYNRDGNIVLIANYDKGIVTGEFKKFHENGIIKQSGTYEKMSKIGVWKYYNEEGDIIRKELYEEGKLIETINN